MLSFLHTVGEFGVVLMLGGDIPGSTRTLSIVLYNQVENFDYAAANRTAAILLGIERGGSRSSSTPKVKSAGAHAVLELALKARRGSFHLEVECRLASDWTVVFGPSGAGKSTLLRLLAGLDKAVPGDRLQEKSHSTAKFSLKQPAASGASPAAGTLRWLPSSPRSSLT